MLLQINGAQLPSNLLIGRMRAGERERERGQHKIRKRERWRGKERSG